LLHEQDRVIKLTAASHKRDIFSLEEVGGAAEVASIGAAKAAGDVRHLGLEGIGKDPWRFDGRVRVADGAIRVLSQKPSHEADAFLLADEISERCQLMVRKHGAVSSEHDLGSGRVFPYELNHAPEFVEGGDDKIDADEVIVLVMDFTEELAFRGIVEDHRRDVDVLCDVIEPPATDHLAIAEDSLTASHLGMKELGTHGIPFVRPPKGTANGGEQQLRHVK
jgi:hypothetical protein